MCICKVCVEFAYSLHKVFIRILTVCIKYAYLYHKVRMKCARCRLCRLGAHPSCLWLLGVVSGPAHGPRAYVEQFAASAWLPVLVAFSQRKEVPLAASQRRRNSAVAAMIITTMQRMSHQVRRLSPPPDIALERIGQTTLGLPASRPIKTPGSNQHGSIPLTPRRSCRIQNTVRILPCAYTSCTPI